MMQAHRNGKINHLKMLVNNRTHDSKAVSDCA